MHAERKKPSPCFANIKCCHGNTIILRIVSKLKNPPPTQKNNISFNYKMINFPNIYMLGMLLLPSVARQHTSLDITCASRHPNYV
jgi:hypothetical protein